MSRHLSLFVDGSSGFSKDNLQCSRSVGVQNCSIDCDTFVSILTFSPLSSQNSIKKASKYHVTASDIRLSLTALTQRVFPALGSSNAVRRALTVGRVLVNQRPAPLHYQLRIGDVLTLRPAKSQRKKVTIPVTIIYEDDYLLVANKPAGIAVNGNRNKTLENALSDTVSTSGLPDALPGPVAAHRLDVPTKGLVLLAKTKTALVGLNRAFQQNNISKTYYAIVHGQPNEDGRIDSPVAGKSALTHFKKLKSVSSRVFGHLSLLELQPVTGRTHQLRIHLQQIGHLIVGDKQYAAEQKTILGKGLFLFAGRLVFTHPISEKPLDFQLELPARFRKLLDREAARF